MFNLLLHYQLTLSMLQIQPPRTNVISWFMLCARAELCNGQLHIILHYFCHPSAARPSRKFSDSLNRMFVALSSIAKPTLVEKKELIIIGKFVKWNTTCVTLCGSLDIIREMMLKLFVYRISIDNDNCVLAKKRRSERFNFILKLNRTKADLMMTRKCFLARITHNLLLNENFRLKSEFCMWSLLAPL